LPFDFCLFDFLSLFFHRAKEREFVFFRQFGDVCDLRFGDFTRKDARDPHAFIMNLQHNTYRIAFRVMEDADEYDDDEIHRRIIIIMQKNFIERRFFDLLLALGYYRLIQFRIILRHISLRRRYEIVDSSAPKVTTDN
jgi:hypothetical protein